MAHLSNADPNVLFLHFDDVDHAGHSHGFPRNEQPYLTAIETTDHHIGQVISTIESRPQYAQEDWLILVTTDHGGHGTSHGGHSYGERTIFLIASGGDIPRKEVSPGQGHTVIPPTVFRHLGLTVDPAWSWNNQHAFGFPRPMPSFPFPHDGSEQAARQLSLNWVSAADAISQMVYFGADPNPGPNEYQGSQTATEFQLLPLAQNTTYYWKIDTLTSQGILPGPVWSFTSKSPFLEGLSAHLDFEGDTQDATGNGNHASLSGSPTLDSAHTGLGLILYGNDDYLTFGAAVELQFESRTDFTVSFWVKTQGWDEDAVFLSNKDWASGSNVGWLISGESDGQNWQWNLRSNSGTRVDFDLAGHIADDR